MAGRAFLLFLLLLALASGAGWYYWHRALRPADAAASTDAAPAKAAPRPVAVEASAVMVDTMERRLTAIGTLESNESVTLRPEIAGRLAVIHFREGERVAKGNPVVELDASAYRAQVAEAEARLGLSRRSAERTHELFNRRMGSASERDESIAAQEVAQAELNFARVQLAKTRIAAPFEGVLGLRRVSVGAYLNPGDPLVTLDDIDPIKVDFRVPEPALPLVRTGQRIEMRLDAFPEQHFEGEIYAIAPRVDVDGRTVSLRALVPNPQGLLKPGLFARVEVVVERREGALVIPEQAVVPQAAGQAVFRVVDGKASLTMVTLGQRRAARVEVLEGLSPADMIVTAGQLKLRDGTPVKVDGTGAASN
jgi:membrane fusion protein (multidrug efflux system)